MAPTVKVEETAIVAEYYYEVDSVEEESSPVMLRLRGGGHKSNPWKKAHSKMRWKWKKKRTRRLQRKRRKMRQRSK